jgi:hypothetical protein
MLPAAAFIEDFGAKFFDLSPSIGVFRIAGATEAAVRDTSEFSAFGLKP